MKRSLRKKYTIVGILLLILFCSMIFFTANILQKKIIVHWNYKFMHGVSDKIVKLIEEAEWDYKKVNIDALAFENNVSVTIADEAFQVLTSTRANELKKGILGPKSRMAIELHKKELETKGNGFYSSFDDNNSAAFIFVSKLKGANYLIVRKSLNGLKNHFMVMQVCFIIATVMTLLCGIGVMYYITGKMVTPIKEINRVTGQIAELNFSEKVQIANRDELGMLAESVNRMSDQLNDAMECLKEDVEGRKLFVRNLAHELKTPLAVIMGYAENVSEIVQIHPEYVDKYSRVISEECERMDSLICRMLEIAKYEEGAEILQKDHFSVEELLREIRTNYCTDFASHKGEYKESIAVSSDIWGNQEIIRDALYNLVKNAVTYGKEDGVIQVCIRQAQNIYFSVYNDGKPIPEREQKKIWELFYKSDQSRKRFDKSFGIGLSIVNHAAKVHGGDVFIRNKDQGVEIGFYIKMK